MRNGIWHELLVIDGKIEFKGPVGRRGLSARLQYADRIGDVTVNCGFVKGQTSIRHDDYVMPPFPTGWGKGFVGLLN